MVIVSPLVALMRLQTRGMKERGVPAVYLGDVCDPQNDGGSSISDIKPGVITHIFASPETLLGHWCREMNTWQCVSQ